jgi:hypothetical protein
MTQLTHEDTRRLAQHFIDKYDLSKVEEFEKSFVDDLGFFLNEVLYSKAGIYVCHPDDYSSCVEKYGSEPEKG